VIQSREAPCSAPAHSPSGAATAVNNVSLTGLTRYSNLLKATGAAALLIGDLEGNREPVLYRSYHSSLYPHGGPAVTEPHRTTAVLYLSPTATVGVGDQLIDDRVGMPASSSRSRVCRRSWRPLSLPRTWSRRGSAAHQCGDAPSLPAGRNLPASSWTPRTSRRRWQGRPTRWAHRPGSGSPGAARSQPAA
jgi:hypothetical protein